MLSPRLQHSPTLRGLALVHHQVHTGRLSQNNDVSMLYNETPGAKSKSEANPSCTTQLTLLLDGLQPQETTGGHDRFARL